MKGYIEREAAIAETRKPRLTDAELRRRLAHIPAADVRPVVRGRWIKHNATHIQKGGMYLECSCCHEYTTVLGHLLAFCPNCGAMMKEPPKEE